MQLVSYPYLFNAANSILNSPGFETTLLSKARSSDLAPSHVSHPLKPIEILFLETIPVLSPTGNEVHYTPVRSYCIYLSSNLIKQHM